MFNVGDRVLFEGEQDVAGMVTDVDKEAERCFVVWDDGVDNDWYDCEQLEAEY